jgi:protoporphyrinogen oxidase
MMSRERIAIVGGGMLGMTLAHRLAQAGSDVTVLEGAPNLGGLASAWNLGPVVWDRHYHVTLLSDSRLRALLAELGLESEMQWVRTKTGFFVDGRHHSLNDIVDFLRFPPLGLIDKFRLGTTILKASRIQDWHALESVSVADWLTKQSGKRTFQKIWLPLLRAKLGENYKLASAAFIWAIIARMYAARRSGLKQEMFGYVPGGYARILDRFAAVLSTEGVKLETDAGVRGVDASPDGVRVEMRAGAVRHFDRVVLTAPAPACMQLCPSLSDDERTRLNGVVYQGIVCASLLARRGLLGNYITNITDERVPYSAVIEMSALVDRANFGGNALIYLPKYVPSGDPWFERSDEDIRKDFLAGLMRMYPQFRFDDVLAFRVSRVRYVLPISTIGYSRRLPPMRTSVPGVHIVNSAHIVKGTLNVNETIELAENAATELLGSPTALRSKAIA